MNRSIVIHSLTWCVIAALGLLHVGGTFSRQMNNTSFPQRPIQVVVPYKAGGGTDIFARLVQRAVNEQGRLGQPLVILNQDGGSGTIGSRTVKQAKPDGYKILCHHDGIMTSQLSGTVNYGPDAFQAIAQTGDMVLLVVTSVDSPYRDLSQLMQQAKRSPQQISFGTNIGSPAHFAGRLLEEAVPGARFQYVQSGGGANRYSLLVGHHIDVGVFSLAEFVQFRTDGRIRALGLLSPDRHPWIPETVTAREQGIDVVSGNGLFWWAPKQTPPDRVRHVADALSAAMKSGYIRDHAVDPVFRSGAALQEYLAQRSTELAAVSMFQPISLPDFSRWTIFLTLALFALLVIGRKVGGRVTSVSMAADNAAEVPREGQSITGARQQVTCFLLLCLYVGVLPWESVDFAMATATMIFLVGATLCLWRRDRLLPLLEASLLTALGTQAIFTRVFLVMLP